MYFPIWSKILPIKVSSELHSTSQCLLKFRILKSQLHLDGGNRAEKSFDWLRDDQHLLMAGVSSSILGSRTKTPQT